MSATLPQKLFSEFLGAALLLAVVIGSGIMAERLAGGNVAIALLANTLATVGGLYVLIEAVATFGLLLVILRAPASRVAAMVAAYIGAAYWFTASTSFANPAAAFGRMFSDSFAGIAPASVPAFVLAQLAGAAGAIAAHRLLGPAGDGASPQETVPADIPAKP